MQSYYVRKPFRGNVELRPKNIVEDDTKEVPENVQKDDTENVQKNDTEEVAEQTKEKLEQKFDRRRRKTFKQMTISEKIDFLVNKPQYIPQMYCIVETSTEKYEVIVEALEEDTVILKKKDEEKAIQLPLNSITSIRLKST